MLAKCFTILANPFYKWYKWLGMLANAYECRCESYECNANETRKRCMVLICIVYIACVSLCLISASLCPMSLFSIKFVLFVHICPALYGNVNSNASESLQMSYNHYKCLANNKNGLRLVTNMLRMVTNMLRICFPSEF